jgi:hypothetical protein
MITLKQIQSDEAKAEFLAARRNTRAYALAAQAAGEESGDDEATLIGAALIDDSLSALSGRAPLADVRHLPSMSKAVRRIVAEMQGVADVADVPTLCPVLAADGVSATDAQAERVRNGRSNTDVRATSERCPYCLAADVVRTLRRDATRDADAMWNRRGA